MEIKDNDRIECFKIVDKGKYVQIHSAAIESGKLNFSQKRLFYKNLKIIERTLKKPWVAYTKITNPVMMRIFKKLGCEPYHMDLAYDSIWFIKREVK